jgi:hypothetical protein
MAIVITTPVSYRVFQRSGTTGSIAITGTYTGSPTAIEASFNGGTYLTIVASPSGGTYSGTLSGQTQGQGTLTVRFTNDINTFATVDYIGIGDIFIIAGQSNAVGQMSDYRPYYHPTLKAGLFGNDYTWKELVDPVDDATGQVDSVSLDTLYHGSCWINLATYLMQDQSVPVAFVPCALVGTVISSWQPGADHQDRTTLYGSMVYRGLQTGCKAVLWWQGESDAVAGTLEATYNASMDTLANSIYSDLGIKLIPCKIFDLDQAPWTSDNTAVNNAIATAWSDNSNVIAGPDFSDLAMTEIGGIHYGNDNSFRVASRWHQSIRRGFGWAVKNKCIQSALDWRASNPTCTFKYAVTSGNTIIVAVAQYGGTTINSSSISDGVNTYHLIDAVRSYSGDSNFRMGLYYAYNVTGGTITVTCTADGTPTIAIFEYSGLITTDPFDKSAYSSGSDTAIDSTNTSTTSQADELLFGFSIQYNGTVNYPHPGSNYILREAFPFGPIENSVYTEDRIVSATGAYNATFTQEANDGFVARIATFKIASSEPDLNVNICPENNWVPGVRIYTP